MGLDIRLPIGLLFAILGGLLTVYGLVTNSDPALYERSLDININLWWGLVLLIFGVLMVLAGRPRTRQAPERTSAAEGLAGAGQGGFSETTSPPG